MGCDTNSPSADRLKEFSFRLKNTPLGFADLQSSPVTHFPHFFCLVLSKTFHLICRIQMATNTLSDVEKQHSYMWQAAAHSPPYKGT